MCHRFRALKIVITTSESKVRISSSARLVLGTNIKTVVLSLIFWSIVVKTITKLWAVLALLLCNGSYKNGNFFFFGLYYTFFFALKWFLLVKRFFMFGTKFVWNRHFTLWGSVVQDSLSPHQTYSNILFRLINCCWSKSLHRSSEPTSKHARDGSHDQLCHRWSTASSEDVLQSTLSTCLYTFCCQLVYMGMSSHFLE